MTLESEKIFAGSSVFSELPGAVIPRTRVTGNPRGTGRARGAVGRRAPDVGTLLPQAGIERVAQAVAEEVDGDNHNHDCEAGDGGDVAGHETVECGLLQ